MKKFAPGAQLYIRPMYWAERNGVGSVPPDPGIDALLLTIYEAPLPEPTGVSITRSHYAKPLAMTMPIDAKAGCLYPNNARALMEARARGFDNCLLFDMLGNVAELATANIFHRPGRRGDDPDGQRLVPQRRDPPARAEAAARRTAAGARGDARLTPISSPPTRSSSSAITAR